MNIEKCHFCLWQLTFLGHIIGQDGISPDDSKLDAVKNFPRPENIRQVRGFLGLCSYYRKFIKDFSKKAKPLNQLLYKDESFLWMESQENAFEILKHYLISLPIIKYPDFTELFILYTDATEKRLDVVLQQKDD